MSRPKGEPKAKGVSYAKWGYIFIIPFVVVYLLCTFLPQALTIYNSFFENYRNGLQQIGPKFVGLRNYIKLFTPDKTGSIDVLRYFWNTMVLWIAGAVPQIGVALLLAVWFTSARLNIKGQGFFKSVIYMPNLIMASAFSMLFFTLFNPTGPIPELLSRAGVIKAEWTNAAGVLDFFQFKFTVRGLVALMNFLMWFGNTTIVLMAGIMGIDQSLFESATLDGASSWKVFTKITVPLLKPILVYTIITALIGGLQMFDVPQVLTNAKGMPDRTSFTLVMLLNNYLSGSRNFGMAGAVSVILFIISATLSFIVYGSLSKEYSGKALRKGGYHKNK